MSAKSVSKEVFTILSGGRLRIKDSDLFIKIIVSGEEINGVSAREAYSALVSYGRKQVKNFYPDIPDQDIEQIVSMAVAKTIKDFDPSKGAQITSFLFDKIKGEVHIYRSKREILNKKVIAALNNPESMHDGNSSYAYSYSRESVGGSDGR
jgi:DNA-directed RNA polymerase specialized sigma subunit